MKAVVTVLVLMVVVLGVVGFYRGWFSVSSQSESGQPSATVTVDKDKFESDKDQAVDSVKDLGK